MTALIIILLLGIPMLMVLDGIVAILISLLMIIIGLFTGR